MLFFSISLQLILIAYIFARAHTKRKNRLELQNRRQKETKREREMSRLKPTSHKLVNQIGSEC